MIVVDTGARYAVFDSAEPAHTACTEFLTTSTQANSGTARSASR